MIFDTQDLVIMPLGGCEFRKIQHNVKSYFTEGPYLKFALVFYIFCPILTEFATDEVQGNLWGPCEYCEVWCYQSHTVVRDINEFLSILSTFTVQFG